MTPNKSQVLFHVEGIDLVSRLIEGQFPNYEPVIPTSHSSRAVIDREAFLAGTRRASIFARDSANIVKIELGGDNGDGTGVAITAHAADVGDNADTVEAAIEGSPTAIAFNARYLIDVLSALGADEAALELSGPLAPGVIRGIGKDDYVHVIMPVRTASWPAGGAARRAAPAASRRPMELTRLALADFRSYAWRSRGPTRA